MTTLTTPVGLIVFNRPSTTQKVFEAIRKAKPAKLFIASDGPRPGRTDDLENCNAVKKIVKNVDWDCQVYTRFSDSNAGCGHGPANGISWIFSQVEEAIILEDDCLPGKDFFAFCQENLARYRNDQRVMLVSGTNYLGEWKASSQSYHFSKYGGIWGWASWRRAWEHFDFKISLWGQQEIRDRLKDTMGEKNFKLRARIYQQTYQGDNVDWWDYQWGFARLIQSGLAIVPSKNLISNLGCGTQGATHLQSGTAAQKFGNQPTFEMKFPLKHNAFVVADDGYDTKLLDAFSGRGSIAQRGTHFILKKFRRVLTS
ncbi:glycosyltransferase family 2 protein [Pelosinus baikalensis]|uniref:Glycosyltransferase family 2 protein n=1 Tax=Pelosinus baikalensis TaxID=2892015 RepID=A0ABS8HLP1_9FIRM|nr:glycosyltransferase family 2 protein [Pelosinus baikalensis]MCC5464088.1 glycosyltransferase family 2 protein [Pelosinus baikalensis]